MDEVLSTAKLVVLPSAMVAIGMMMLAAMLLLVVARYLPFDWRRGLRFATPVALFAAIAAVNHFRDQPLPWWPDGKWWHEAIFLFAAAFVIDLLSPLTDRFRLTPWLIGLAGGLAASIVISPNLRADMRAMLPLAGAAIASNGWLMHRLATRHESSANGVALTAWTGAVSMVLLHAKSLGLADLALGASVAAGIVTAIAMLTKSTIRFWSIVMPLTGLLFMNRQLVDSDVPRWLLVATGSIPLIVVVTCVRPSSRASAIAAGLIAIASIAVVVTAAVVAPMTFTPQEW